MTFIRPVTVHIPLPPPHFGSNSSGNYHELFSPGPGQPPLGDHGTYDYATRRGRDFPDATLMKLIKAHTRRGDVVVELGCNEGNNVVPLAKSGRRVYGVDLFAPKLWQLQTNAVNAGVQDRIATRVWDFAEDGALPPEWDAVKGQVKAIYAVHVVPHLDDDCLIRTMQRLQEYLAPGGVIIISNIEDRDTSAWGPLDRQYVHTGGYSHNRSIIEEAFRGLTLLAARKFNRRDKASVRFWYPPHQVEPLAGMMWWYVFQKPDPAVAAGPEWLKKLRGVFRSFQR